MDDSHDALILTRHNLTVMAAEKKRIHEMAIMADVDEVLLL
jgi:hypothetical protein